MDDLVFVLNGKEFKIPYTKTNLDKIPSKKEKIWKELSQKAHHVVETQVDDEIFDSYLKYWKSDSLPEITAKNIWFFYQLSEEFGLLSDYLSQPQFENLFNLSYLINIEENSNFDKSDIEKKVSQNLIFYLKNFKDDMKNIQINSLYNIFYHSERKLEDHDLAYQFIVENPNFYLLLSSLDSNKMKNLEYKKDACLNRDKHYGFCPQNTSDFFIELDQRLKEENEKNQKLESTLNYFIKQAQKIIDNHQNCEQNIMPIINQKMKDLNFVQKLKVACILQEVSIKVDKLINQEHKSPNEAFEIIMQVLNSVEESPSDKSQEPEEIPRLIIDKISSII